MYKIRVRRITGRLLFYLLFVLPPLSLSLLERYNTIDFFKNSPLSSRDDSLSAYVRKFFVNYRPRAGCVVLLEVHSGRVLVLEEWNLPDAWERNDFPFASLFKFITLSGVIEEKMYGRKDMVEYRGYPHSYIKEAWEKCDKKKMSLSKAFGISNNPLFAELGKKLGKERLLKYAYRAGFNTTYFDLSWGWVNEDEDVEYLASGLAGSYGGPLHAALVGYAIASGGWLIRPSFSRLAWKRVIGRFVSERTAREILEASEYTVKYGTAREVWREAHPPFRAGGKTGSLTGSNPRGRYEWFVGFAPLEAPEVVVAVLIVNGKYWRLKSSYLALKVMEEYLKRRGYVN